jgi:hypothetical protein
VRPRRKRRRVAAPLRVALGYQLIVGPLAVEAVVAGSRALEVYARQSGFHLVEVFVDHDRVGERTSFNHLIITLNGRRGREQQTTVLLTGWADLGPNILARRDSWRALDSTGAEIRVISGDSPYAEPAVDSGSS